MLFTKNRLRAFVAALAVALALPATALADTVSFDPGVTDPVTDVTFNKQAYSGEHANLVGAHLQILDASGTVIDEWDSDGSGHAIRTTLKVDTEYTLHETKAPEGYAIAPDIKFTVGSTDNSVTVTNDSTSGGYYEASQKVLTMFDAKQGETVTRVPTVNQVTQPSTTTSTTTASTTGSGPTAKTDDPTSYLPVVLLLVAGGALVAVALYRRKSVPAQSQGEDASRPEGKR